MLTLLIIVTFFISVLMPYIIRILSKKYSWVTALFPASLFVFFLSKVPEVSKSNIIYESFSWYPTLGVDLQFKLDGLSLLLSLLITGIGTLIFIYAHGYLGKHELLDRFYLLISVFMTAMLGLVLSDNLLLLFVFWEITTITSYLLVGFNHNSETARKSALQALIVTGIGGLIMLAGFLVLGSIAGTFTISELNFTEESVNSSLMSVITFLIIAGCFTKSAQFPFHFWLPNAMAAPTPVSAYLHSATMVKAGIYLMYRLNPVFEGNIMWANSLVFAGAITMLFAAGSGLFYRDLKKILAYSTLSVLGMLTMLAGIGTDLSIKAGMAVLLAHALYKATLFMVAGSIDHETGTRDTLVLGGLRKVMTWTFAAALLAGLSQAGLPPFYGFIGKEYLLKSNLYSDLPVVLSTLTVTAGGLVALLAFSVCIHPFFGEFKKTPKEHVHEAPFSMLAGPIILSGCGIIFGLMPFLVDSHLIEKAAFHAGSMYRKPFKLWEGFNTALLLSLVSIAVAVTGYKFRQKVWQFADRMAAKSSFRFDLLFTAGLNTFIKFCKWQTKIVQNGSLKMYMVISITGFLLILSVTLFNLESIPYEVDFKNVGLAEVLLFLVLIAAAVLAIFSNSLMSSLVAMGIIGFGLAVIYTLYGAPDLAITQIMVETLTAVMFMAVIYKLPPLKRYGSRRTTLTDFTFSLFCGLIVTLLILKAQALQISTPVSETMGNISYSEAKGKNVVNVILVDFRALDTLGEITVLLTAALGAGILLRNVRNRKAAK